MTENGPDLRANNAFERAMLDMLNVAPVGKGGDLAVKRTFFGVVWIRGEKVVINEWRNVIDLEREARYRLSCFDDEPIYRTSDGREVQCTGGKYVDQDALEGDWKILDYDGRWTRLDVSAHA